MGHVLRRVGPGLWALLAVGVVAVALFGLARLDAQDPSQKDPAGTKEPVITQLQFQPLYDNRSVLVVDVRDAGSFNRGHIPGSMHVPVRDVERRVAEVRRAAKGRLVVAYCSCPSEATSLMAARVFNDAGVITKALLGGLPRWVEFGGRVEKKERAHRPI